MSAIKGKNTFVEVLQPDSPHKSSPNLVDSARLDACASLFMSAAAWTLASARGFSLGNLERFPLRHIQMGILRG